MMYHPIIKKAPSDMHLIAIKYGIWMLAGFVSFFLLMIIMGLGQHSELRLFNGVIQIMFLYWAIKAYYSRHPENTDNYLYGVAQGMKVSAIGVVGFGVFMTIYLSLDSTLMENLRENSLMGEYLNPFTANLFVLTEGLTVSLIISYILTRIIGNSMKKD